MRAKQKWLGRPPSRAATRSARRLAGPAKASGGYVLALPMRPWREKESGGPARLARKAAWFGGSGDCLRNAERKAGQARLAAAAAQPACATGAARCSATRRRRRRQSCGVVASTLRPPWRRNALPWGSHFTDEQAGSGIARASANAAPRQWEGEGTGDIQLKASSLDHLPNGTGAAAAAEALALRALSAARLGRKMGTWRRNWAVRSSTSFGAFSKGWHEFANLGLEICSHVFYAIIIVRSSGRNFFVITTVNNKITNNFLL